MIYYILFNFSLSFIILLTYAFLGFNLCKAFTSLICSLILFFLSFNFNCSIFSFNLSICIKYLSNFVVLYLPLIILICSLILSILFVDPHSNFLLRPRSTVFSLTAVVSSNCFSNVFKFSKCFKLRANKSLNPTILF